MAQLDAASFVVRLHGQPRCAEVPVIVVAAYEERDCIDRALGAGAAEHLLSPIDHFEFRSRLRNLLRVRGLEARPRRSRIAPAPIAPHPRPSPLSPEAGQPAVRASERLLRVLDAVPGLVCATDRDGRYIFCNQRFAAFVGLRPGRLIGRQPLEAHDDPLARSLHELDRRLLAGEQLPATFEEQIVDREGKRCDLLTTKAVYNGGDGDTAMVVTVALDITGRKRPSSTCSRSRSRPRSTIAARQNSSPI